MKYDPFRWVAYGTLLLMSCMGCASSTIKTDLVVEAEDSKATHARFPNAPSLALLPFKIGDAIHADNVVGQAKTGMFNAKTDIIVKEPITRIFEDALASGFKKAGCELVSPERAKYIVEGKIETFWVDEYATGLSMEYSKAHVMIDVVIRDPTGKVLWATSIDKFGTSDTSMDTTQENIPTLMSVLRSAVSSIIEDATLSGILQQ